MDSSDDEQGWEEKNEDWYRDSDTSENIPEPNDIDAPLYQDRNELPTDLSKEHFEEGLIYTMTMLSKRKEQTLVMIIEAGIEDFVYRPFFIRGSSKKTFHQGLRDKKESYNNVWRLAPRRELARRRDPSEVMVGETIRFTYGMGDKYQTCLVMERRSISLKCRHECGKERGKIQSYEIVEILDCTELFRSSILQNMLAQVKDLC